MANICNTSLAFHGTDKCQLERLRKSLFDLIENNRPANRRDLKLIAETFDLGEMDHECFRAYIDYISSEVCSIWTDNGIDSGDYLFIIEQEDDWEPHLEVYKRLLKKPENIGIEMDFLAEEPSWDFYVNSDKTHKYFDNKYCIDICFDIDCIPESLEILKDRVEPGWIASSVYEFFSTDEQLLSYVRENITARYTTVEELLKDKDINVRVYENTFAYMY